MEKFCKFDSEEPPNCPPHAQAVAKNRSTHITFLIRKPLLLPESCTKYRSEVQKALYLKRSWSDFDPQAYYLYVEDQNHETSFKGKALQAVVDSWCKIQVLFFHYSVYMQGYL
jgi:hypothetical protein